jgi:hypothetical protein
LKHERSINATINESLLVRDNLDNDLAVSLSSRQKIIFDLGNQVTTNVSPSEISHQQNAHKSQLTGAYDTALTATFFNAP